MNVVTKLCFNGCADDAIRLYQEVFGCRIRSLIHYRDAVQNGWEPPCPSKDGTVYHSELFFGETEVRIADDPGENAALTRRIDHPVGMDSAEEVERAFELLAKEGEVIQPLERPPYMVIIGAVRDKFGVLWTLMCDYK